MYDGQAVVRPTFAKLYADNYTRGTDMTERGYTEASETLTIDQTPAILLRADRFDALQHQSPLIERLSKDGMRAINKHIDSDYLAEVVNATSTVDAGDVGGSAGSPITLDATNVLQIFAAAQRKLQLRDVSISGQPDPRPDVGNMKPGGAAGFANLSPYLLEQLNYSLAGRETSNGDMIGKNGYEKTYFGFDCFATTGGYWTGVLAMATTPTDGDTVVINGVTFTFKTTLGATPGNVLIGGSADVARANLVALINAPGTTTANGVALSEANQNLMKGVSATNDNTANTATVIAQGWGYLVVSETFTDATDAWSSEIASQMFGQKGAVDMVLQDEPGVAVSDIPLQFGKYIKPFCLYGIKTFTEGADALVKVQLNSAAWV